MTNLSKVHCFFEQSGTFKNEFIKLGIPAEDYDIRNDFGETDHVIDLFKEIEKGYLGKKSVFDDITQDELIIAFFPCTFFCENNLLFFNGTSKFFKNYTIREKTDYILRRSKDRQISYEVALKLFSLCDTRLIRLIVENPCSFGHYLYNNFPYKPTVIDKNRQIRGDYFHKPTQYWFVNCMPTYGNSFQNPKKRLKVLKEKSIKRSLLSPDYARNFICDFILGIEQDFSFKSLF